VERGHCGVSETMRGEGSGEAAAWAFQYKSIDYFINSTFRKIFNTRSQETVGVCLEMFGCLQAERTIAIRKRKFLSKFSVIHNALCGVFVAIAKTELESCCTHV